jgi:hypothetical protein
MRLNCKEIIPLKIIIVIIILKPKKKIMLEFPKMPKPKYKIWLKNYPNLIAPTKSLNPYKKIDIMLNKDSIKI